MDLSPEQIRGAFDLLNGLQGRGIHYDLRAVGDALARRDRPERAVPAIIVAGTNGKGSTAAMIHAVLTRLGYRAGLYTSPHLLRVNERIRIGRREISDAELAGWVLRYEAEGLLADLTYYEMLTAAAFEAFRAHGLDWAILEVGVGGRLDAVNLAPAEGAVITTIDFDHRELLGDTLPEIAAEKAGVVKEGKAVIAGALGPEAMEVVEKTVRERHALLYAENSAFTVTHSGNGYLYEGLTLQYVEKLGLQGEHQAHNMACALAAVERIVGIDLSSVGDEVRAALAEVRWPARLHELRRDPLVVVDGAHNPAGSRALAHAWRSLYGAGEVTIVFGTLADKEHNAMLGALRLPGARFWLTQPPGALRAERAEAVAADPALAGAETELVSAESLVSRMRAAAPETRFLVTGSLLFCGWFLGVWAASEGS